MRYGIAITKITGCPPLSLTFGERDGQKTKREKSGLDKKKEGGETREGVYDDEAASAILRHGSGMARQAGNTKEARYHSR